MPTNNNNSAYAPAGYVFSGGLGAELTAATSITLTDAVHVVSGSATITTINGGYAHNSNVSYLIKKSGSTWLFGSGGNIVGPLPPDVPENGVITLLWDQTYWRIQSSDLQPTFVNVLAHGLIGDNSTDNTAALNAILAVYNAKTPGLPTTGAVIYFPAGVYKFTGESVVAFHGMTFLGDGRSASKLRFEPTATNKTFLTFQMSTAISINYCAIRDLEFRSADTTYVKTMVKIVDSSTFSFTRCHINGCYDATSASIGIDYRGRELLDCGTSLIAANIPIICNDDPNLTIDNDHAHFHDLDLLPTGNPAFQIVKGVNVTNFTMDGRNAFVGGTAGFYWNDTGVGASSVTGDGVDISGIRWEGATAAGYHVYIARDASVQRGVTIKKVTGGLLTTNKGFYLRGLDRALVESCIYTGTSEAINADGCIDLTVRNCWLNPSSTVNWNSLIQTDQRGTRWTSSGNMPVSTSETWSTTIGSYSSQRMNRFLFNVADNTTTTLVTVTVPNANHAAGIFIRLIGALGDQDSTQSATYSFAVSRIAGANAKMVASSEAVASATAGATANCDVQLTASAVSGGITAVNTFTIDCKIVRSAGASTNHDAVALIEVVNVKTPGVSVN